VHLELCGVDRGLVRFLGRHVAPLTSGKRSCPHVVPRAGGYKARRREPAGLEVGALKPEAPLDAVSFLRQLPVWALREGAQLARA
jgi:hypothetical protein